MYSNYFYILVYDAYGPFKIPTGNIDTLSPIKT